MSGYEDRRQTQGWAISGNFVQLNWESVSEPEPAIRISIDRGRHEEAVILLPLEDAQHMAEEVWKLAKRERQNQTGVGDAET